MEEEVKELGDYLDIIRRHKYWVLIPAVILIALSGLVAYLLPATYKSEGLILIESQEIPNDLVRSTVTSYADQRIEVIKQRIMTTSKVMVLVRKHNLYPDLRKKAPISEIVGLFRENIAVTMVEANVTDPNSGRTRRATIAFRVSFMDKSPQLAQKVANDLVTEFLVENTRVRTERASETTKFLEAEANKFQKQIQFTENKIAEFKDKYSDSLPELLDHNLSITERSQTELAYNQNQIHALKDLATTLRLELVNINPYITQQIPGAGNQIPVLTAAQKLLQTQAEHDRLSARYSENHPDIKALNNQISDLEQQVEEEAKSLDKPSSNGRFTRTRNPIYGQLSAKVNASEREVLRLQQRNELITQKIANYDERIVRTHQVKRAYDDLTRDHENKLRKYEELRAKQLEAELAQNLESENKGESFTLIEPPLVPSKAEKPDRVKLFVMGVVVSIGAGLGLALLIEMLFGGVRGYNQMTRILGKAPLVVIPMITTVQDLQKRTRGRLKIMVAAIILLGLCVAGFHYWVMDLEVFWFKLLRKISLL
ncbi:MAG: sugar transporter [Methylophaga sp.]|nr:MAG: sugar transporter [Methylophaga sp.]